MKRWQIEQILYLNDFGKRKLAIPESQELLNQGQQFQFLKKENLLLTSARKCFTFLLNVL